MHYPCGSHGLTGKPSNRQDKQLIDTIWIIETWQNNYIKHVNLIFLVVLSVLCDQLHSPVTTATELCFTSKATSPELVLLNCLRKTVRKRCEHLWWQNSIVHKQNWVVRLWEHQHSGGSWRSIFHASASVLTKQTTVTSTRYLRLTWVNVDLWLGRSLSQGIFLLRNCSYTRRSWQHSPEHGRSTCWMQNWQAISTTKW